MDHTFEPGAGYSPRGIARPGAAIARPGAVTRAPGIRIL
jgi:hypothetical protein